MAFCACYSKCNYFCKDPKAKKRVMHFSGPIGWKTQKVFSCRTHDSPSADRMNLATPPNNSAFPRLAFVSGLVFGGSTTFLCNLTGEIVRRGVPVLVVSPEHENPLASDFQAAGVKVILQRDS